jgi:hypothetical protein
VHSEVQRIEARRDQLGDGPAGAPVSAPHLSSDGGLIAASGAAGGSGQGALGLVAREADCAAM